MTVSHRAMPVVASLERYNTTFYTGRWHIRIPPYLVQVAGFGEGPCVQHKPAVQRAWY